MAENGLSLQKKLEDAEYFDNMEELQEIAEEMFTRFYSASCTAAGEKAKNLTLMQEIQRLEKENGRLRTELDNEQDKLARARDEVEKCAEIVKNQLRAVEKLKEENRVLSEENYKMETQIRQMVAKAAKNGDPSGVREDATSPCAGEALAPVACPRCGSIDLSVLPKNQRICCVCGEVTTNG